MSLISTSDHLRFAVPARTWEKFLRLRRWRSRGKEPSRTRAESLSYADDGDDFLFAECHVCITPPTMSMEFGERRGEADDDKRFFSIVRLNRSWNWVSLCYATIPGTRMSRSITNVLIRRKCIWERHIFLDIIFSLSARGRTANSIPKTKPSASRSFVLRSNMNAAVLQLDWSDNCI